MTLTRKPHAKVLQRHQHIREQLAQHIFAERRRAVEVALQLVSQVNESLGRVTKGSEVKGQSAIRLTA